MAKKEKSLSQEQIKIRILAYLYNKARIWSNSYTIQHRANIPSQHFGRFKGFLDELVIIKFIEIEEVETGGEKFRISYRITSKGKNLVDKYRDPHISELFGSIEDLFNP